MCGKVQRLAGIKYHYISGLMKSDIWFQENCADSRTSLHAMD